ncbi:1430_t:CDS:2 [Funneliformis geosporum]|uniref:1430_t:CDS:1 n=1 Tax=Funneliformis geosporum TaxID=1117311 RepID=A0A9W4WM35_9GLOM|nr:1430_t:CDS:2 [Funneliformis geosporum]
MSYDENQVDRTKSKKAELDQNPAPDFSHPIEMIGIAGIWKPEVSTDGEIEIDFDVLPKFF